ncbi:MAG: hypothetical protein NXH90_02155 [Flavobacteriaceae bacterium]|nr:hypothetical protein [Flavobacteriaceae bacterium]
MDIFRSGLILLTGEFHKSVLDQKSHGHLTYGCFEFMDFYIFPVFQTKDGGFVSLKNL